MITENSANNNNFSFSSSTNCDKYGGLLRKTAYRQLRKEITELFAYIFSVSPSFLALHKIMTFFRLLQLVGPSLCYGFVDFWSHDVICEKVLYVYSIFFHLVPASAQDTFGYYFLYFYIAITFLFISVICVSAKMYKKNANLPSWLPPSIYFFVASLGFVLLPIAFYLLFSQISKAVFSSVNDIQILVIITVLIFILSAIYIYIYFIILQVLTFQPMSLMTVTPTPQSIVLSTTLVISILHGFANYAPKIGRVVLLFVLAILNLGASFVVFYQGGFVTHLDSVLFIAVTGATCLQDPIMAIFVILNLKASLILIGVNIGIVIVVFLISNQVMKQTRIKRLTLLDNIQDNVELFETLIKDVNTFINTAVAGFSEAHPFCINWSLLKLGIEKWPKDGNVWLIYAKFIAIYPEEIMTLAWIYRSVVSNKVKGNSAKIVKSQSVSIARQREANLSPDLKMKLNVIAKHITQSKQRLRNVWDLAIQGNIFDIEQASRRAIDSIEKSDSEMMHIMRLFPNNRFVTRQYARFCRELKADFQTYSEMVDKSRLLQRNMIVNKDQSHEYGILAFPSLPERIKRNEPIITNDTLTSSMSEMDPEDADGNDRDETNVFITRIDKLRIPSTFGIAMISIFLFLVIFAAPVIAILVYTPIFIDSISHPLTYMQSIALARTLNYQLATFTLDVVMELWGVYAKPEIIRAEPPANFGSTYESNKQLAYICKTLTNVMQDVESFRTFKDSDPNVAIAKDRIFGSNINYRYYEGITYTAKNITVQAAIADMVGTQVIFFQDDLSSVPEDIINTSTELNPASGATLVADAFDKALSDLIKYISNKDKSYKKTINIIMYAAICCAVVLYIVSMIISIFWIKSNKIEAYKCLTSIPKNTVSMLAENLRIIKKNNTENSSTATVNSETSKQEDNIMKLFMTGGTGGVSSFGDTIASALGFMISMVLHIICTFLVCNMLISLSNNLRISAPHVNYLQGIYANLIALTNAMNSLVGFCDPRTKVTSVDKANVLKRIDERIGRVRNYYHMARFGGEEVDEPPYSGYKDRVVIANELYACPNKYQITSDMLTCFKCYSPDDLIVSIEGIYQSRKVPYVLDEQNHPLLENDPVYRVMWTLLIYPIYEIFIYPMYESIVETLKKDLTLIFNSNLPIIIVLLVIALIIEAIYLYHIELVDRHIRSVLRLLLHCPVSVLASTSKAMAVISGDFRKSRGDYGTRSDKFYNNVVSDLPKGIIICSYEKTIEMFNKSFTRILNIEDENSIVNMPINDLVNESRFVGGDINNLINNAQAHKPIKESFVYKKTEGNDVNFEAISFLLNGKLVIEVNETTQQVRYNKLINEEKQKSDILLSSILPQSLVKRVQQGETNISFAVQSATIVFMDIVSFTPWCGSLPAEKVMSTLNRLFMKNDALLSRYPTMTKIKCIGDCYMAAGGVFVEINQPSEHAKEVVNFGLDSLTAIGELNTELNEHLQIRVGINTGGPIVAGVLGIGKPTFEILGPAINMAQQMEHHGVPMQVHVSRSVYELIYGGKFSIKERGQVEVKNGTVITYLVGRI